ncbi:MAG TPA: DMT family transporter [Polyangia bacterium]|jgi:drug/metabolite transporter (DMT)-like permease
MHATASRHRDGLAFAAITVLAWGLTGIFVRLLPGVPAVIVVGGRLLIALAAVGPLVLLSRARRAQAAAVARSADAWQLALAMVAYYLLAVTAYQLGSVAEVALLIATSPGFVLLARAARGGRIPTAEKLGAALALGGVVLVLAPKLAAAEIGAGRRLAGDLLALLAAGASAIYAGKFRALHERDAAPDAALVAVLSFAAGAAALLLAGAAAAPAGLATALTPGRLVVFVGLGLLSTAVPTITYGLAARHLPPVVATTTQLLIPVLATLAAAALLRELPSLWVVPGGALVLCGIATMVRGAARAAPVPVVD